MRLLLLLLHRHAASIHCRAAWPGCDSTANNSTRGQRPDEVCAQRAVLGTSTQAHSVCCLCVVQDGGDPDVAASPRDIVYTLDASEAAAAVSKGVELAPSVLATTDLRCGGVSWCDGEGCFGRHVRACEVHVVAAARSRARARTVDGSDFARADDGCKHKARLHVHVHSKTT